MSRIDHRFAGEGEGAVLEHLAPGAQGGARSGARESAAEADASDPDGIGDDEGMIALVQRAEDGGSLYLCSLYSW
jgi:hypothetical protein